ncbi:AAA family ATPase [Paenibacillus illinoisensis]|uniref:AAA family ATPase n=1 Tax=Paenibacillus illinoisensis TaxID=59845 RepID=UPI003D2E9428
MYRIFYLELHNFRGKDKLSFQFADEPVTIMYGRNGAGKTTLLKVIHALLSLNDSLLASEDIKKALLVFKNSKTGELLHLSAEEHEGSYEWGSDANELDQFIDSLSSIVFGVNRGITNNQTNVTIAPGDIHKFLINRNVRLVEVSDIKSRSTAALLEDLADNLNSQMKLKSRRFRKLKMDFNQENEKHLMLESLSMEYVEQSLYERYRWEKRSITHRVQKALFETLALLLDNHGRVTLNGTHKDLISKLGNYKGTLLDVLSQLEENDVIIKIKDILSNYSPGEDDSDPFEGKDLLLYLVSNMIDELELGEGLLNTVKLIDEFNTYLPDDKKLVINEGGVYIQTEKSMHGIERLSSGEKHLLSFLTLFIINGRERKIWMIDEPEISLHLDWQSKLLSVLAQFVPDAQIIVATHSPAIAEFGTNNLMELKDEYSQKIL